MSATKKAQMRLEDSTEYVREKIKMNKFEKELEKANGKLKELHALHTKAVLVGGSCGDDAVKALLAKKPEDIGVDGDIPPVDMEAINKNTVDVRRRIRVLESAVENQRVILKTTENKMAKKIADANLGDYRQIVKRMVDSLMQVNTVIEAEEQFREALAEVHPHIPGYLFPMDLRRIGKINDPYSYASHFLREAHHFGHIPKSALPKT